MRATLAERCGKCGPQALSADSIEERYRFENEMLDAVAHDNAALALELYQSFHVRRPGKRFADPLREKRNYLMIFNTLCRKTAEKAAVHPVYIDEISRNFAIRIEQVCSVKESDAMFLELLRQYCACVNEHSLKEFSPLVKKTITYIDLHMGERVSLDVLSEHCAVNSSYLCTRFKRETGMTITAFATQHRLKRARQMMQNTDLTISEIASKVGIYDINYFSRCYKKEYGVSPSENRKILRI